MPSISTIKSDPNRFCRDVDGAVISGSQNLTAQACRIEVVTLLKLMLFSQIRKQSEFSKYIDGTSEANKRLNKYVRHCKHKSIPINVCNMCTLYTTAVFNQPNFFRSWKSIDISNMYNTYTATLTAYWYCLAPDIAFALFIPACLYLMRSGVTVDGVQIIMRSRELEHILPEASTLDLYQVQKAAFTNIKNLILKEIRSHAPNELRARIIQKKNIMTARLRH
jgi:hypothetical protein